MERKSAKVPNITCDHCVKTIERELGELEGVVSVKGEVESKTVTVEWKEPATWDSIGALMSKINYPVEG